MEEDGLRIDVPLLQPLPEVKVKKWQEELSMKIEDVFVENGTTSAISIGDVCDGRVMRYIGKAIAWESQLLWSLSGSAIVVTVGNFAMSLVTQMFAGQLGALELAGASIANVGIQGLAYGIMFGMSCTVQTLCGQAYGAKKYSALGVVCQKSMIVMTGAALVLSLLYWFSGTVLIAIGQTESIAEQGQIFARGLLPQLFALALYDPMQKFLQAQNIVNPLAYIALVILGVHGGLSWLVVDYFGYGLFGAALTLSFSWWLLVMVTAVYIRFSPACKKTWCGFSREALQGLWPFLKLTLASAVMLCLEIWYSQGIVIISGLLPDPEVSLDSITICMNYLNMDLMCMLGLGVAASVRVGNELGASRPLTARFSVIVVVTTSILISILLGSLVLAFKGLLSSPFTTSVKIIDTVSSLSPLLAISFFLNGIQPILSGVAIGCGWQTLVAYVNLTTYYVIGLPIGLVLGFVEGLGVTGIWWGMIGGVALQTITLLFVTARSNWNKEVDNAKDRLEKSAQEVESIDSSPNP